MLEEHRRAAGVEEGQRTALELELKKLRTEVAEIAKTFDEKIKEAIAKFK